MEQKRKPPTLFWPEINDRIDAEALVRRAVGICVFIAAMSVTLSLLYKYQIIDIPLAKDAWGSALVYGVLAYFISEHSKIASWITLIVYIGDRIYTLKSTGAGGLAIAVIFICSFIACIRALDYLEKNPTDKSEEENIPKAS
ncbi:hypothetical protein ACES2I_10840 [Bdellovibrio bacteriovorus]|uniref:hypothetical protein n=1 Tax=Bdellovibrio bacteriovorus TaxID=959 RepID=UPI0035A5EA20